MAFFKQVLLVLISSSAILVHAQNLGAVGQVYDIKEEDAIDMILNKLKEKEKSGELKKLESEAKTRALDSMKNPKPVMGIVATIEKKSKLLDPSVTYDEDIRTDDGQLIVAAGTRINPLDYISLSKSLVFFDGNDPDQVSAVKGLVDTYKTAIKPILISGSWFELSKKWKQQVYFDQGGFLSQKFEIESVPSVVRQVEKSIEVAAIPAKELK